MVHQPAFPAQQDVDPKIAVAHPCRRQIVDAHRSGAWSGLCDTYRTGEREAAECHAHVSFGEVRRHGRAATEVHLDALGHLDRLLDDDLERERMYQRLKRQRSRALRRLKNLLGTASPLLLASGF